jgi:tryptophanyl-tRNA synthetase
MVTDPARKRKSDPGNPDVCPVFDLHKIFTPAADREMCATSADGGVRLPGLQGRAAPAHAAAAVQDSRSPPGVRREAGHHQEVLFEGSRRARAVAQQTMTEVRNAVKLVP